MNNNLNVKMIRNIFRKVLILVLCLAITSCGGFSITAGLEFKKEVGAKSHGGNPGFTSDIIKLNNNLVVGFDRPIGNCGAGITLFGILIPIIPVKFTLNNCKKSFSIDVSSLKISSLELKYDGNIHKTISVEKLTENTGYEYGKKFKFKIDNFWKFRVADDKSIIISGKIEDGTKFTKELPVKWGVVTHNHWVFP